MRTLSSILASCFLANCVLACRCSWPPIEAAVEHASAVFAGRVAALRFEVEQMDGRRIEVVVATFDRLLPLKGVEASAVSVDVRTYWTSCAVTLEIGRGYLIYAPFSEGALRISQCDRTPPLQEVGIDLKGEIAVDQSGVTEIEIVRAILRKEK